MRGRRVAARGHLIVMGGCGLVLAAMVALSTSPAAVEAWMAGPGGLPARALSAVTGLVPLSLAEWLVAGLAPAGAVAVTLGVRAVRGGHRSAREVVASGLLGLGSVGAVALVLFYGIWGLNYARAPAAERLGWDDVAIDDREALAELAGLAEALVNLTNTAYVGVHGAEDAGHPTGLGGLDLDAVIDDAYRRVQRELGLPASFALSRGPVKPLLSSPVVSWLGISGFYLPFTSEANINTLPPVWARPHVVAHEKAHQRGIASEDEANFFGFLACVESESPVVRYTGWLFAQRRLLFSLIPNDPDRAEALVGRRLPGVQRDVDAVRAFWAGWRGRGTALGSAVNDAYLRANQVEGGIQSYGLSARLIVAWARTRPDLLQVASQASGQDSAASSSRR